MTQSATFVGGIVYVKSLGTESSLGGSEDRFKLKHTLTPQNFFNHLSSVMLDSDLPQIVHALNGGVVSRVISHFPNVPVGLCHKPLLIREPIRVVCSLGISCNHDAFVSSEPSNDDETDRCYPPSL